MSWPNWKNADEYPDPKSTKNIQWAWEFLRRNKNYQADYAKYIDGWQRDFFYIPDELQEKYKFDRQSALPSPEEKEPYVVVIDEDNDRMSLSLLFSWDESGHNIEKQRDTEETISFDLEAPIEKQIARAKKHLLFMQKEQGFTQFRAQLQKYPDYLRILDAIKHNISITEIAANLFPTDENIYPYYRANDKVKKMLVAAEEMRDSKYYLLGTLQKDETPLSRSFGNYSEDWPVITRGK